MAKAQCKEMSIKITYAAKKRIQWPPCKILGTQQHLHILKELCYAEKLT